MVLVALIVVLVKVLESGGIGANSSFVVMVHVLVLGDARASHNIE